MMNMHTTLFEGILAAPKGSWQGFGVIASKQRNTSLFSIYRYQALNIWSGKSKFSWNFKWEWMTEGVIELSVKNCFLMEKITLNLMENCFLGRVLSDLLLAINFMPSYLSYSYLRYLCSMHVLFGL
jgi:hypothetical protein